MADRKEVLVAHKSSVVVPMRPNFISSGESSIPIQDFTDRELRKIAKAWTDLLLADAKSKRKRDRP